jgi:ribonuclease Z
MVPNIGVRIEFSSGQVMTYSSDTAPCNETVKLAKGSDVLMHEASGEGNGHTSPAQAGEIAHQAGVGKLILIHYDGVKAVPEQMIAESRSTFSGPVQVAQDFMELDFSG